MQVQRNRSVSVSQSSDITHNESKRASSSSNLSSAHDGSNEALIATSSSESSRSEHSNYVPHSDMLTRPLEVVVPKMPDFDGIDFENLNLDDECEYLDEQIEYWEQEVAKLERVRCTADVPKLLVENVIKLRKELRELEVQEYALDLESYEPDGFLEICELSASKFGSKIRPGQENTADILDAIPPSGSLQHQQYLCRTSTGSESSE